MIDPFLEKHSNPETFNAGPVFIFTDKAIVPATKGSPPEARGKEAAPPPVQPEEGDQG